MTTIISKSGTGIPASDKLETAELAVDTSNGNLYTKLDDGSVVQLNDGADDVDLSDYVTEAPIDTKQYARQDGDWSEIVIPDGGTGSSVHIGENPPQPPISEGQQWMEVPVSGDATMWIYDGDKWLQQPGGKDGADGADGKDGGIEEAPNDGIQYARQSEGWAEVKGGLWTDNGDTSISYTAGNVGIGEANPSANLQISDPNGPVLQMSHTGQTTAKISTSDGGAVDISASGAGSTGSLSFTTGDNERMRIDANGNVAVGNTDSTYDPKIIMAGPANATATFSGGRKSIGFKFTNPDGDLMTISSSGRVDITGSLYVNGSPKIGTVDMIKAFSKLRDAVKDENTVESLKESITNCIGGLIEEWESMQSPATQEISDE